MLLSAPERRLTLPPYRPVAYTAGMALFTKLPRSEAPGPSVAPRYPLRTLEEVLAHIDDETPEEARMRWEDRTLPFEVRWVGQLKALRHLTDEEIDDLRYEYLKKKYLT